MKLNYILITLIIFLIIPTALACNYRSPSLTIECTSNELINNLSNQTFCLNDACDLKLKTNSSKNHITYEITGVNKKWEVDVFSDQFKKEGNNTTIIFDKKLLNMDINKKTHYNNNNYKKYYELNLETLKYFCEDFSEEEKNLLTKEVKNWVLDSEDTNMYFIPAEKIKNYYRYKKDEYLCYYSELKNINSNILIVEKTNYFCSKGVSFESFCGTKYRSPLLFYSYSFTDINSKTIPYLIIGTLIIISLVIIITYLLKKHKFINFIKPNYWSIIPLLLSISSYLIIWNLEYSLYVLIITYLINNTLVYLKKRIF